MACLVRVAESELAGFDEVETVHRQVTTLRPVERVADGVAHIGRADMGHQRAVAEADKGVDQGFRVDHDLDLVGGYAEVFARLDHLHRLVEKRGAVDGDALAHIPVGVCRGLGQRCGFELFEGPVAEGAAGGGDDDAFDRAPISSPARAWKMAECSLSTGRMVAPRRSPLRP